MFVFFEFFALFFKNLWINHLNHLSQTPVRIPKCAAKGCFPAARKSLEMPASNPPLVLAALCGD